MPILPNNDLDYIDEESEDITSEDMTDGSSVTENNATYNDPFDYNGPADIGVPDSLPVDPVVPESSEDRYYVTYYNRGDLTDYEPAYLQELAEAGCKFYAIYDDETEVEIQWTEIEDLDPLETEIDISASIAAASNQHFWDDTNGVHVAEVAKEDWQTALEANFSDLSASKNYYNILMNSLGLLLRRANFILTSINRASISFYDGLGNETTNIMASFGRNSAQIGRSNDKHVVIDNSGLTAYNSDGTLAPLTGTFDGANINNSSITNAKIVDGTIEGTKIASATIDNSNIKNGTIEGSKIASATIDNSNIKNGTITGAKIADGTIENTDIKNGTITGTKIAAATIENSNIKDGTIQGTKIVGSTLTGIPYAGISDADIEVARVANAEIAKAEVNYAHITNGVIDNAKINHADVNGLSANYATVANLNAATARIGALEAADVTIDGRLDAAEADIDDLEAEDARIGNLVAQKASITDLNAATARIGDLEADHVSVEDFEAEQANIDTLQANTADIATIRANSAKVQNLTAAQLEADHATVGSLSTTYATITNLNAATGRISDLESTRVRTTDLEANYITADTIEANYTKTDLSNTDVAWIQNGTIKDGAISNAMIGSLSASKLTAGTINGNTITVTNLNADNITAGTLNGQRIGEGSLSLSKLEEDVYTESEVDSIVSNLQTQIDGAIETWTGTAVPTLNNSPASGWTTNAVKDTHVGDVYFVVNSNSQQNGYNYRFTKSGSTYSWQLIKDSDVTNALQRLTTAEGKITTFDSDISQLKTDTGTLTTKTTSLETRMSDAEADILDKVDTTTFNEVSDTVDSHSQSITQMSTTLSNKADSSTVSAVTQRVSKNEQDISGINTTIGIMQTTLASKADGSTVETMSTKLNTVSDTVDGHTQSISSINSTLSTKADSSTVSTLSTKVNTIEDTVDGHTQSLQSVTSTQTSIQQNAVKSTVQLWFTKANTTAPNKPTAHVTTNNATTGNAWNLAVPTYNASYPNYYYCYEYQYLDGSYGWSAVTRDIATGEMQATARQAQSDIDNLEIGGRNLLTGIKSKFPKSGSATGHYIEFTVANHLLKDAVSLEADVEYTFSVEVTSSVEPFIITVGCGNQDFSKDIASITNQTSGRIYITFTPTASLLSSGDIFAFRAPRYSSSKTFTYSVDQPKLEKGNRATDWTPAPEDVDADILIAQTSADNAQATADKNVKESVQLWFTKANGSAPSKPTAAVTSTSTSGNAWTTKVPTYSASYPYYFYCMQYKLADDTYTWSDVVYDQATTEAQSVARTTSTNLSTLQQDYATFKQTSQNFESTIGTTYATKTEVSAVDDKIDNLEIGGRNLLAYSTMREYAGGNIRAAGSYYSIINNEIVATSQPLDNILPGWQFSVDDYILSGTTSLTSVAIWAQGYNSSDQKVGGQKSKNVQVDSNGYFETTIANLILEGSSYFNIGIGAINVANYSIKPKLEKGNKATDWTPAPEDVDASIAAVPRMARINAPSSNFTMAQWKTFGSMGYSANWSTGASYNNSHLRIGDRAYLTGTISDQNGGTVTIIGEVTKVQPADSGTSYVAMKSEQLIFGGDVVSAIESRVTNAETSITQTNQQIALKANASDVYTKTQTDGLISTEVSNRNSAIEQSASAINLSVSETYTTKTEFNNRDFDFDNLMPNARTMALGTSSYSVGRWRVAGNADMSKSRVEIEDGPFGSCGAFQLVGTQTVTSDASCFGMDSFPVVSGERYRMSLYARVLEGSGYAGISQVLTGSSQNRKYVDSNTTYSWASYQCIPLTASWKQVWVEFEALSSASNLYIGGVGTDAKIQICMVSLKVSQTSHTELESAKSEIKTTTDSITSTVEKISSAKYLTSSVSAGAPLSSIRGFASTTTTFQVTDTKDSRVGDTIYLKYKDSTRNCYVYIKGVVTVVNSSTSITLDTQGYEDVLPVDTIKSTINQSSDSVKIQARHVEIDGAAIFSNSDFKAAADAAYDAIGSASAVQNNLDNLEIGGRNLLRYDVKNMAFGNGVVLINPNYRGMYCAVTEGTYTVSRKVIEGNRFAIYWCIEEPASNVTLHQLFYDATALQATVDIPETANWLFIYLSDQGDTINNGNIKVERGTKATDWTPAPEDVSADISTAISTAVEQANAPIDSKTYTGIIGTANSFAGANFFFGKLYPDNYNKGWQAKLRVECEAPDTYQQSLDITFGGYGSTFSSYDSVTSLSSSRAFYYFELFRATSTGINANVGHMLGISLQSATNPTNSSYARTIRVDILEVTNCTIELNNTAVAYTSMAGYSVENYGDGTTNLTQMNVAAAGQNATNNTNTNDTARYVQFYNTIVAGEALVKESLIGGHEDGKFYQISGANDYFMLSQPLLWITIALNANATNYANIYTQCYDRNLATYYTSFANTLANKIVYLVGTINGDKFTIYGSASNQYLTVTEPTTADGRFYIPLGRLGNQSNGKNYFNFQVSYPVSLYAYLDGKFRQVTPTEIVGEQYIYCSAVSGTNSMAKYETWVEPPTSVTASTQNSWTIKRPEYSSSYPVLFVAKQTKRLDGTVTCTTPVKDDTTTIIDGGHITTGTIDASVVTVTNLDASEITSGTIAADRIKANVISAVNNGTGTINADKINASSLTIGYSQLTNPPTIPSKVSDLTNDSGFQTSSQVDTAITSKGYATTTQAQGYADAKDAAIAAAAKRTDVSIAVTAINYDLGMATLQATLYVDGTATTSNVTYKWLKDGSVISGQTARTLSVTAAMGLSHVYSCTVTYS